MIQTDFDIDAVSFSGFSDSNSNKTTIGQIMIVKGWEGFADRLQVLSHCMEYCKKTGATLCVDWRDYMWSHDPKYDFNYYFEIVGIQTITIEEAIDHIHSLGPSVPGPSGTPSDPPSETTSSSDPKKEAKIFPPVWTPATLAQEPCELFHFPEYENTVEIRVAQLYSQYDVIVHNGKGNRTYHSSNLLTNLRFKIDVCDHIKPRLSSLFQTPYSAIHLRGTDRLSGKTLEQHIEYVTEQYESLDPHEKQRVLIVTDMDELRNLAIRQIPTAEYLPNPKVALLPKGSKRGRHMLRKEALEFYGLEKRDLVLDALADFIVLCLSDRIISNQPESLFSKMAELLRSNGGKMGIKKWFAEE
jgi:hypothetical protein